MTQDADAKGTFPAKIPNGNAFVADGYKALSHLNITNGGGERNLFGKAFAAANFTWTVALC